MTDVPSASLTARAIDFHMIKSNHFRVAHADGIYGGVTPHGNVHCTFYSERSAIPRRTRRTIRDDGSNSSEENVDTLGGVVRELEVDVVMSLTAATAFYFWLAPQIEQLRTSIGMSDDAWSEMKAALSATAQRPQP